MNGNSNPLLPLTHAQYFVQWLQNAGYRMLGLPCPYLRTTAKKYFLYIPRHVNLLDADLVRRLSYRPEGKREMHLACAYLTYLVGQTFCVSVGDLAPVVAG